jgi:hypothetical protein
MSRDASDRYYTPHALALALCRIVDEHLDDAPRNILEPCAGGGAITRAAREVWPRAGVKENDPDPAAGLLSVLTLADLATRIEGWYDAIITNPPFSGYKQHIADLRRIQHRTGAHILAVILRETAVAHLLEPDPPHYSYRTPIRPRWEGPDGVHNRASDTVGTEILVWRYGDNGLGETIMRRLPDWRPRGRR